MNYQITPALFLSFVLTCFVLTSIISQQPIIAGDVQNMIVRNFDPPLDLAATNPLSFDLTGDGVDDVAIKYHGYPIGNNLTTEWTRLMLVDSTFETCYLEAAQTNHKRSRTVHRYLEGDTLVCNFFSHWSNQDSIIIHGQQGGGQSLSGWVPWEHGYIGLRKMTEEGYLYGWIEAENWSGINTWNVNRWAFQNEDVLSSSDDLTFEGLDIFPNPADAVLWVRSTDQLNIEILGVFDILGRQVALDKYDTGPIIEINTSNMLPGYYSLSMRVQNRLFTRRFIVR